MTQTLRQTHISLGNRAVRRNTKRVARCRIAAPRATSEPTTEQQATPFSSAVTIEYQRQQAKAMQQYFKAMKEQQIIDASKVFGWTKKNEINNGRWVMMGFGIGLLTEYATGVSFIDQIRLMLSYLGVVDLDY